MALARVETLNGMAAAEFPEFEAQIALLFEHSPELSKALFAKRPFTSHAWLIDTGVLRHIQRHYLLSLSLPYLGGSDWPGVLYEMAPDLDG